MKILISSLLIQFQHVAFQIKLKVEGKKTFPTALSIISLEKVWNIYLFIYLYSCDVHLSHFEKPN